MANMFNLSHIFDKTWVEHHLLYFALIIFIITSLIWIINTWREIKILDKQKRKIQKRILKLLAKFKNKI